MVKGLEVFREHFQSAGNSLEADESCIATSQTIGDIPGVDSRSWCDVEGHAKVVDVIPGDMPQKYFCSCRENSFCLPLVWLPQATFEAPRQPDLSIQFRPAFSASESAHPHIFLRYENIGYFSWRRFFKMTDRDSDLLNSK